MTTIRTHRPLDSSRQPLDGNRRVTINDLAGHLGMSKSTVSRALNGYADISESTRNRVKSTAKKLGYRPLSHAQAIRTGRVKAIALVLQNDEADGPNPFLQDFLAGACQAVSDLGWTLTISTAKSDDDMEQVLARLIEERKADGFILPRTAVQDPRVAQLQQLAVPHILFGRTGYGQPQGCGNSSWFDISGEAAMCDAVQRLVAQGHRRIAFVGSDPKFNFSHLRRDGFIEGLDKAGLPVDETLLREGARRREEGAAETRALLQLQKPPTAIVFATDMAALGAYSVAADHGLEIGQELSIIGYDGVPESQYAQPALTTYNVDTRMAGERLATLLIQQIHGEPVERLRELREAHLVERDSDGPPALTSQQLARKIQKS